MFELNMIRKNASFARLRSRLAGFLADESGASAVEYGILVALISIALIGALVTLSGGIKNTFNIISNALASL